MTDETKTNINQTDDEVKQNEQKTAENHTINLAPESEKELEKGSENQSPINGDDGLNEKKVNTNGNNNINIDGNKGTVNSNKNENTNNVNINLYAEDILGKKKSSGFSENSNQANLQEDKITIKVTSKIPGVSEIDFFNIEELYDKLIERRLWIINCVDGKINHGIENKIVEAFGGYDDEFEIRRWVFRRDENDGRNLDLKSFKDKKIGKGNSTITFIYNLGLSFIQNLNDAILLENMRSYFQVKNMVVVFFLTHPPEEVYEYSKAITNDLEHLPFLLPLLQQYFDKVQSQTLANEIENSRFWQTHSEYELFSVLKEELEERKAIFKNFVEEIDKKVLDKFEQEFNELKELFNSSDFIYQVVLFSASFFDRLSYRDFELIIKILLHEETELLKSKKGKKKKKNKDSLCIDRWRKEASKIFEICKLTHVEHEGEYFVEFEQILVKNKLKKYIESKRFPFLQSQLDKIKREDLLFRFDLKLTPRLLKNILRITIESTKFEKEIYNQDWLVGLVIQIKNIIAKHYKEPIELSSDPYTQLIQILEKIENIEKNKELNQFIKLFFKRLGELVEEMFAQDKKRFQEVVEEFIRELINKNMGKFSLEIVLEISKRLQDNFDKIKWLKHILHQDKNFEVKHLTYRALIRVYENSLEELKELMEEMLPEKEGEIKNSLNTFALRFQVDYCILTILDCDKEKYGLNPSEYRLLSQIDDEDAQTTKEFITILEWLFDEKVFEILQDLVDLNEVNKKLNIEPIPFIGNIIETWFTILLGFKLDENFDKTKEKRLQEFIRLVVKTAGKQKIKKCLRWWGIKAGDIYGESIGLISEKINENISQKEKREFKENIKDLKIQRTIIRILMKRTKAEIQNN